MSECVCAREFWGIGRAAVLCGYCVDQHRFVACTHLTPLLPPVCAIQWKKLCLVSEDLNEKGFLTTMPWPLPPHPNAKTFLMCDHTRMHTHTHTHTHHTHTHIGARTHTHTHTHTREQSLNTYWLTCKHTHIYPCARAVTRALTHSFTH